MADGPSADGKNALSFCCPLRIRKVQGVVYPPTLHRAEGNLTGNHFPCQ
jgi:hypothetical protein